jgi:hypothetical protein
MDEVVKIVNDKITKVTGNLIEPMELYYKHYSTTSVETLA